MDGAYSEGASEAAQRDEAFSNLSTKPNISEENECGQPETLVPHSQSVEEKAQYLFEHQPEAQLLAPYRSQSVDQGNQSSSNRSSGLQYPSQSRPLQQQPKQPAGVIVSSTGKAYQLKTFDENWENEFKQQEEEREKYHELINTNNEPLLSQKDQHQFQFGTNQLLLTQKDQHQIQFGTDQMLLTQKEVTYQEERRDVDQLSNEIKFDNLKGKGQEIEEVSEHPSSQSQKGKEQPCQPLFELVFNDNSQSNLLDFGFRVQSQRRSDGESNRFSHQQITSHQPQQPSAPAYLEEPMDIVQETIQPKQSDSSQHIEMRVNNSQQPSAPAYQEEPMDIAWESIQPKSSESSQHIQVRVESPQQPSVPANQEEPMDIIQEIIQPKQSDPSQHIEIRVSNCQVQNSTIKNNDIYGITQIRKEDDSQVKKYQQSQQIKYQNPFRIEQQPIDIQKDFKRPLSLQETIEEMASILQKDITQQQKAEQGYQLLKDHINLYFLKPLSEIGTAIMRDGKSAINLIEIILLKEKEENREGFLKKYLILTLAKEISTNFDAFVDYQQAFIFKDPRYQQLSDQASINKNRNDSLDQTNLTVNEVDESNYAENGSHNSIQKSPNYMVDATEEPVKRTVANRNFVASTEARQSPKSGKVTRRRYKTKAKGKASKTSVKKSQVQFQIPEEENEGPAKFTRSKGRPKSGKKEPVPVKKEEEVSKPKSGKKQLQRLQENRVVKQADKKDLGCVFTFIQRQDRRDSGKQLVQVRLSQRLAQKKDRSPSGHRYSSSKIYDDQPIDLDYIKKHLPQFKIVYEQMDQDYGAFSARDQEILAMLKEYFRLQEQMEEEERSQNRSQEGGDYAGEVEECSTISMSDMQSNTRARLEEFKRNLDKYKPSDFALPISVARVIDPDINNHGIYALLELGRISEFILKARYALAPITALSAKLRKKIDQDLATAKEMVGDERDNLAYLQPTPRILELIREQKQRRQQ